MVSICKCAILTPLLLICSRDDRLSIPASEEAYWALFKAHLDDALVERIRETINGNYALGDRRCQAEIEQALGKRVTKGKAGRKVQPEHRRGATRLAMESWSVPNGTTLRTQHVVFPVA
jgi:hypothetical protein